jgi:hypothetical protein
LDVEAQYQAVFDSVGGLPAVEECRLESTQIASKVSRRTGRDGPIDPWLQDPVYLGLKPAVLMRDAEHIHDKFEQVCHSLLDVLAQHELKGEVMVAALKGIVRSMTKIRVKYGGDLCKLSDVARATLKITTEDKGALKRTYAAMHAMVSDPPPGMQFLFFDDRFGRAMSGGYKDFLFLVSVCGIVCELHARDQRGCGPREL